MSGSISVTIILSKEGESQEGEKPLEYGTLRVAFADGEMFDSLLSKQVRETTRNGWIVTLNKEIYSRMAQSMKQFLHIISSEAVQVIKTFIDILLRRLKRPFDQTESMETSRVWS